MIWFLAPLAASTAALALGAWLLSRPRSTVFQLTAGLALVSSGLAAACEAAMLLAPPRTGVCSRLALSLELAHMVTLLFLGATLIGRSGRRDLEARRRAYAGTIVALALLPLVWLPSAFEQMAPDFPALTAGFTGKIVKLGLTLGLVVALAQFESVLRLSPEAQRYRLKYVLLGLGAPAAYRIYAASQVLLFGVRWPLQTLVGALVTLVGVAMVAVGLARQRAGTRVEPVEVSPQVVYGSLTALVVGAYLIAVALFGELLRASGLELALGLAELAVFLLSLLLVVVVASRHARARFRQLVARHFLRSRHDFRAQWLAVTDSFRDADSEDAVFDVLLRLIAGTFGAGRVSIWSRFDADGRFHQVRSLNLEPAPAPLDPEHVLPVLLARRDGPVALLEGPHAGALAEFVEETQAALAVPVIQRGVVSGFVLLGRPPEGRAYDDDDFDLLRAIAHHVGVLLTQLRLAEDHRAGAELAALHRFSAFCLHDVKNLAARLSLVAQNTRKHGDDPAFRAAAFDTVARTARELAGLMEKLRTARSGEQQMREMVDVGDLFCRVLGTIDPALAMAFATPPDLPRVRGSSSELEQLLLNLVVNAKQAKAGSLEGIRVEVSEQAGDVVLRVSDDGPGIPPERLRRLLRPFETTKPDGLGIGLYECRRIVESYGGRLRIQSQPGVGTTVEVRLPAATRDDTGDEAAMAANERRAL